MPRAYKTAPTFVGQMAYMRIFYLFTWAYCRAHGEQFADGLVIENGRVPPTEACGHVGGMDFGSTPAAACGVSRPSGDRSLASGKR